MKELSQDSYSNVAISEVLGVDERTTRRDSANAEEAIKNRNEINNENNQDSANADPIDAVAALAADEKLKAEAKREKRNRV